MTEIGEELGGNAREALGQAWKRTLKRRRNSDPSGHFPWHHIQEWMLEAPGLIDNPVRVILIVGGNRSGKSKLAMGLMDQILQRESPINDQLMTTDPYTGQVRHKEDSDPLRFWVVPPTGEKFREDWVNPADGMGIRYWMGDRFVDKRQSPDYVFMGAPPGVDPRDESGEIDESKCDRILGKSQDQDILTFEASEVDVAIFDEEPSRPEIVTSTMMRVATSNGCIIFAFTPLQGLSWSYDKWWKPLVEQGRATKVAERRWVHAPNDEEMGGIVLCQMGMADNPRAETFAKEVMADPSRTEAEKQARVFGEYGFVEGALIEKLAGMDLVNPNPEHKPYVVDELPEPEETVDWYLVADPNKSYGALLSCLDSDGNLFFVAEHLRENWPNRKHAEAFKAMEKKFATGKVQRYADPGSAGSQSIIDLEDFGLYFDTVDKGGGSVSRSIKRLRGMAWIDPDHIHPITGEQGAPRLYFYAPGLVSKYEQAGVTVIGSRLTDQLSQARQKENAAPDTPDKDSTNKLDLFDCARYTSDLAMARGPTEQDTRPKPKDENRLRSDEDAVFGEEGWDRDLRTAEIYTPEYGFG